MENCDLRFEIAHIGINCADEAEAESVAKLFCKLFGFEMKVGNSSIFAGESIEVMKTKFLGQNGHIAIRTNDVEKAVEKLKVDGFEVNMDTAKLDATGKIKSVYLYDEIGGFAIHLLAAK
ncbi:MAG: VOC family protein [Clostridiales bacterium]|nr:VOC family protein [Clostridiales bacterium]